VLAHKAAFACGSIVLVHKAALACGSMVLYVFLYVVFRPAGLKTTYRWELERIVIPNP
jgi:hypothetical protein